MFPRFRFGAGFGAPGGPAHAFSAEYGNAAFEDGDLEETEREHEFKPEGSE